MRRILIAAAGALLLLVGLLLVFLPGPGWAFLLAGLATLATEFAWARRALAWARSKVRRQRADEDRGPERP